MKNNTDKTHTCSDPQKGAKGKGRYTGRAAEMGDYWPFAVKLIKPCYPEKVVV